MTEGGETGEGITPEFQGCWTFHHIMAKHGPHLNPVDSRATKDEATQDNSSM